jgi:hypothetical protein
MRRACFFSMSGFAVAFGDKADLPIALRNVGL